MFNIGPMELLVIAVLALVVLGPDKLPDAARQAGKVMGELRRLSNGFQQEIKNALDEADQPSSAAAIDSVASQAPAPEGSSTTDESTADADDPAGPPSPLD